MMSSLGLPLSNRSSLTAINMVLVMCSTKLVHSGVRQTVSGTNVNKMDSWGVRPRRTLIISHSHVSILTTGSKWHNKMNINKSNRMYLVAKAWWPVIGSSGKVPLLFYSLCRVWATFFSPYYFFGSSSCHKWKLTGYTGIEYAKEMLSQFIPSSNRIMGHFSFNFYPRLDSSGVGLCSGRTFSGLGINYTLEILELAISVSDEVLPLIRDKLFSCLLTFLGDVCSVLANDLCNNNYRKFSLNTTMVQADQHSPV